MKKRIGFVSNSSSSSFVIAKTALTEEQIESIKNHSTLGAEYGIPYGDEWGWTIEEDEHTIEGYISMDNFDMDEFLEKIGVDSNHIKWGS